MKKTYISPSTKVVNICLTQMIAASVSLSFSETNYDGSTTIESRRNSWDDEEEWDDEEW